MAISASACERQIHELVEKVHAKTGIPGLSVSISIDGVGSTITAGTNSSDGLIPLSVDSRFQMGCITKLLTSLVAVELMHSSVLNLDSPIGEYLHEFADIPKGREILVRHLGSHTSGYQGLNIATPESAYFYTWEKFVAFFRDTPQMFTPGTVFNYEHTECVLLGEILRRLTRTPPLQLATELILDPLRLTVGTIKADIRDPLIRVADSAPHGENGGFKELRSVPYCDFWTASLSSTTISTSDLAKLGEALIGLRHSRLGNRTLEHVRTPLVHVPQQAGGPRSEKMPRAFGFGSAQYGGALFGHNGSARGQTCGFRYDPVLRAVIVVALNSWQPYVRDFLIKQIAEHIAPSVSALESACLVEDWSWSELEGSYASCVHGVSLVSSRDGDQLTCEIVNKSIGATATMTLSRDPQGTLVVQSSAQHLSVGLFHDAASGAPCMMVGLNAFRKVS